MGKLASIRQQLEGKPSEKVLIDQLFQGLFDTTSRNSQAISSEVSQSISALQGALKSTSETSQKEMMDALEDVVRAIAATQKEVVNRLTKRIDGLESKLSKMPTQKDIDNAVRGEVLGSAKSLRKDIKSIPVTDLSEVQKVLHVIVDLVNREPESVRPDIEALSKRLDKPREWEFEIKREDFSDRITSVSVKEV